MGGINWRPALLALTAGCLSIAAAAESTPVALEAAPVAAVPVWEIPPQTDADRVLARRLIAAWASQRSDVATCDIYYRTFNSTVAGHRSLAELVAACSRFDPGDADSMRDFIAEVNGAPYAIQPPWGLGRLVISGRKQFNKVGEFTYVNDGDLFIQRDGYNRQYNVFATGRSSVACEDLNSFRIWLNPSLEESWLRILDNGPEGVGVVTIFPNVDPDSHPPQTRLVVDETTGNVVSLLMLTSDRRPSQAEWYLGQTDFGDGLSIPRAAVKANFNNGVCTFMSVRAIESARFNQPVDDGNFTIGAQKANVIVDYQDGEHPFYMPENSADLAEFMRQRSAVRPPPAADIRPSGVKRWLLLVNGLICLAAGVLLWRSAARRRSHSSVNSTAAATDDSQPFLPPES